MDKRHGACGLKKQTREVDKKSELQIEISHLAERAVNVDGWRGADSATSCKRLTVHGIGQYEQRKAKVYLEVESGRPWRNTSE